MSPGLIRVPLPKGCELLLTEREFVAGIKRGKWWRRTQAAARREANAGTPTSTTSAGEGPTLAAHSYRKRR